jgi:ketosteroid isomerase-like protein
MGIERGKIEAAYAEIRRLTEMGDWSGWADLFAEDGTFINSALKEAICGREALRSFFATWPSKVVNRPEWVVVDGNRLVVGWNERHNEMRSEAPAYRGFQTFVFNDDGLIASYEGMFDTAAVAAATAP